MLRKNHWHVMAAAAAITTLGAIDPAAGQDWPSRAISMVVPFSAGSASDTAGRIVAVRMSEILGQQVIVENTGGAGGMTGTVRVVNAPPDGTMFSFGSTDTIALNQTLYKKPLYNSATDLVPVTLVVDQPMILIVRSDLPVNTHPQHVPYRGSGQAMQDLAGGRIDYFCALGAAAVGPLASKTAKPIALLGRERSPLFPDVGSSQEQGLPGVDTYFWSGFLYPKGTPDAIVQKLQKVTSEALDTPAIQERLKNVGTVPVPPERRSPEYFKKLVIDEIASWEKTIKASGISID